MLNITKKVCSFITVLGQANVHLHSTSYWKYYI